MFPENIERKVEFLIQYPQFAMVYSDGYKGKNIKEKESIQLSKLIKHRSGQIFNELINEGNFIPALSVLIKRDILIEIDGYDTQYMIEDYPTWIKVAYKYPIGYIPEQLVFYRDNPSSITNTSLEKMYNNQEKLLLNISKTYNIDVSKPLDRLFFNASVIFFEKDRDKSVKFRNKIVNDNFKVKVFDFIIKTKLANLIIKSILRLAKR